VLGVEELTHDGALGGLIVFKVELGDGAGGADLDRRFKELEGARVGFNLHSEPVVVEVKQVKNNGVEGFTGRVGVRSTDHVWGRGVNLGGVRQAGLVDDKGKQVIHVPDREELGGQGGVALFDEGMKLVFEEGTVEDSKGRTKGAAHGNANSLAQELGAGGEKDVVEVMGDNSKDVGLGEPEVGGGGGGAVGKIRFVKLVLGDGNAFAAAHVGIEEPLYRV
jgi:hypothetical protein